MAFKVDTYCSCLTPFNVVISGVWFHIFWVVLHIIAVSISITIHSENIFRILIRVLEKKGRQGDDREVWERENKLEHKGRVRETTGVIDRRNEKVRFSLDIFSSFSYKFLDMLWRSTLYYLLFLFNVICCCCY